MAEKKPHKIDPKVGDRLVIPADRYREEREVVVVSVARIKFQTVNADKHDDYQNYIQSTSNTIAFHNRFGLTTWRKDTAQEDGWGGSGPRVATRARLDEEKRERAASVYLSSEIGISSWDLSRKKVVGVLELANLIRTHLGLEEL